ncbi:hypothetical protein SAMN05660199_00164 [Klenkia soli]|uniref:PhiRv1 phage protein n=1 Tax=Klenkia soli TaxID=1052260 RepID=A0A1H0BZS1_9ACTN|nr:hypothetical protein [Klenkia soli]SDN51099.1 hypothetical protein SAMN05660199_00164 [Klenkia soli]
MSSQSERARAQWAGLTPEERAARLVPAHRARKYTNAEDYIRRLVDSAPPLTEEQRTTLAGILAPAHRKLKASA